MKEIIKVLYFSSLQILKEYTKLNVLPIQHNYYVLSFRLPSVNKFITIVRTTVLAGLELCGQYKIWNRSLQSFCLND